MANNRTSSIEFIVKPREDLSLEGSLRKLPRVTKGEPYPCQMQKNQAFSCLFRHYAKHNGLRKEDLVFYFVDELLPDQTPEGVHLMSQDEIWVSHRKPLEKSKEAEVDILSYCDHFRSLIDSPTHSDITFIVGDSEEQMFGHKSILSARSDFFRAMFKKGGMVESIENRVIIRQHDRTTFGRMLEFLYTNSVRNLDQCQTQEVINLLVLANEYCLDQLQRICETAGSKILSNDNIGRFTILSMNYDTIILKSACKSYLNSNVVNLRRDEKFRKDIEESPMLGLFLFDTWPEDGYNGTMQSTPASSAKRRRVSSGLNESIDRDYLLLSQSQSEFVGTQVGSISQHDI